MMKIPLIALVTMFSFPIPAVVGLVRYRHLNTAMRVFCVFCVFTCFIVIYEFALSRQHMNNTFVANYFVPVECIFFSVVFSLSIGSKKIKQLIAALTLLFLCIWVLDRIYFDIPGQLNSQMAITSRIFIILISVLTIHTIANHIDHPFTIQPMFWVASSALLYSTGVALIVGLMNDLIKMGITYFQTAWYINWSLEILCNLMYTRGFFCTAKYQISSGS